jgi:hypothetical protein
VNNIPSVSLGGPVHLIDPASVNLSMLPCVALVDKRLLPSCPAIYFVVVADANEVVYIGCSRSLSQRWYQHSHRARFVQLPHVLLYWLALPSSDHIYAIEKAFIDYWKPCFNAPSARRIAWLTANKDFVKVPIELPKDLLLWVRETYGNGGLSRLTRYLLNAERQRRTA